jgi:uncharacterized protein
LRKILCIDGGGIKGVFPASFLSSIETSINDNVSNYFDLIVGTSTGGIIALGIGLGYSSQEILKFYEDLGPRVFRKTWVLSSIKSLFLSKYRQEPLLAALREKFGDWKMGDCRTRVVIPSLCLEDGDVYIYKTAHHPRFEKDFKVPIVDIAIATASAPSYFPAFRSGEALPLVDGGMWANNPLSVAVTEAIGILKWPSDDIRILSLGCTTAPLDVGLGRKFGLGIGYWGLKITDLFLHAQSSASLSVAQVLVGKDNIVRISPKVANGRFSLDGISEIESLKGLGAKEARIAIPELRRLFFSEMAEKFLPFHT